MDDRPEDQRIPLQGGVLRNIESLERWRTPGLERRLAALESDASRRVLTGAGLLMTRWKLPVDRARYVPLLGDADAKVAQRASAILTLTGGMEGIEFLIRQAASEGPSSKAYVALGRYADEPRLTNEQRVRAAILVIERLVPTTEPAGRSAICEALQARRWTGQDFGYRVGASAAENNRALERYHEWARHPTPITQPASRPEAESGQQQG